jgi:Reverse transcriptase (RNA-dependent DNA polymerase)
MPFPLPKIQDLLLKMEGFTYATALDLNMGYYHVRLDAASKKLCTLVFLWGKFEMQCLPMGLSNSPDIFQEKMSELMYGLENVRANIDDLLVISKGTFTEHLADVDQVLKRLRDAGLKVNASKSSFAQQKLEYLGYWITREGIQPQPKKIQEILSIKTPTNKTLLLP